VGSLLKFDAFDACDRSPASGGTIAADSLAHALTLNKPNARLLRPRID